jgi:hypothetical protein
MRIALFLSPNKFAERQLAGDLRSGIPAKFEWVDEVGPGFDFAVVVGIKRKPIIRALQARGTPFLYFDKGHNRRWNAVQPDWWRLAINDYQPTHYLGRLNFPDDRADAQDWRVKPWRHKGSHIVFAGASAKYHAFYELDDPTAYAADVIRKLKTLTRRPIVYRSKPSWRGAEPIDGAKFIGQARHPISDDLRGAHALVTHGSNACLDALLAGVPSVVLGNGTVGTISSKSLDEIENPILASMESCKQLLANMAYCQWSDREIRSGAMWKRVPALIEAAQCT